jgi:3-deoxy-D-manno-octulosonate 8-phosphate phosphatase (KDO 8-P phosphatase)
VDLDARAARLRLLLFDVDGVFTDGTILLDATGAESKRFHIRDGTAIVWAHRAGLLTGLLSARHAASTAQRAAQLGIRIVHQGVASKLEGYEHILRDHELGDDQVGYMGDDLLDVPVLRRVGLAAAPADAAPEVLERVHWVSPSPGGGGAVRDLITLVLRAQQKWESLAASYLAERAGP